MKRLLFLLGLLLLAPRIAAGASCTTCDDATTNSKRVFVDFTQTEIPLIYTGGALATAADNQVDVINLPGTYLEYIQQGANTDIIPTRDSTGVSWNGATVKGGWVIPNDQTDNEGIEISQGVTAGISKGHFTVGTETASLSLTFAIPDVSDYDVVLVGWRKVAAYCAAITQPTSNAAGPDCYTDIAGFNVNAGDIYSVTNLNSAGLVAADTAANWLDTEVHTLKVEVDIAGDVTWYVDNTAVAAAALGANAGFGFDATDPIMPMIVFTRSAGAASDTPPILLQLRIGY